MDCRGMQGGRQVTLRASFSFHGEKARRDYFSTMDTVAGEVTISALQHINYDRVKVTFVARSETCITTSGPLGGTYQQIAYHRFLEMQQPVDRRRLPQPGALEVGRMYNLPFAFTIPAQLLDKTCAAPNDHVRIAHRQLPPSMGAAYNDGNDSFTPDTAEITYAVEVAILWHDERTGEPRTLTTASKPLAVRPVYEEQPPVFVDTNNDAEYRLRVERAVRTGLLWCKLLGNLTAETRQPPSVDILLEGGLSSSSSLPSAAAVLLRFDPSGASGGAMVPPALCHLSSKLKVRTYYATQPQRDFPSSDKLIFEPTTRCACTKTLTLLPHCKAALRWQEHASSPPPSPPPPPPPSPQQTSSHPNDLLSTGGESDRDGVDGVSSCHRYYTACLPIPVQLPRDVGFAPTFHSCLVSRVYRLDIALSFPGCLPICLRVPLQLKVRGGGTGGSYGGVDDGHLSETDSDSALCEYADLAQQS